MRKKYIEMITDLHVEGNSKEEKREEGGLNIGTYY